MRIKIDISTSQIVWYEGEQGVIRHISKGGKVITLDLDSGRVVKTTLEGLLYYNPDLVYEEVEEYA